MAPVTNGRVIFNEIPTDFPEPGKTTVYDTSETIDVDALELKPESFVAKVLSLSVDPYLRGRMYPNAARALPPFYLGKPIDGEGIGVIVKSSHPQIKVGDHVFGRLPFAEYSVQEKPLLGGLGIHVLKNEEGLPWSAYLGVLGMPGRTSYHGWKEFSGAEKGETAFITSGAGPVGSLVIQLAKRDGLKVIASAGSDEKVEFMKSLGADVAFNYKTTSTEEVLKKEGPIDVYWDNVGGSSLDAALGAAALNARFIECGMISSLDAPLILKNAMAIVTKRLRILGLIVWDLDDKYGKEFIDTVPQLVAKGEIKYREEVTEGLDKAGDVILAVQKGEHKAKAVVLVAKE